MVESRHKRDDRARATRTPTRSSHRRRGRGAALIGAGTLTAALAVGALAVTSRDPSPGAAPRPVDLTAPADQAAARATREGAEVSRDLSRMRVGGDLAPKAVGVARAAAQERAERRRERQATAKAVRQADTRLYATANLNIWTEAKRGDKRGLIDEGDKVLVTGRTRDGRTEVVLDRQARWVTNGYLSKDKPLGAGAGLSMAPCPSSAIEGGLTSAAIYVYRSVCHAFPQITTYGGRDGHGEHVNGEAIDIMVSDVALGTAIAEFLRSHSAELGLYDIIWRQHIWTPDRAGEGWRSMSSRGSATADHYDHVHVKVT